MGDFDVSEMYLGVDVGEDFLTVALTENSEPVATLTEPLSETSFERFCDTAIGIIADLAQEYDVIAFFLDGNTIIVDVIQFSFQFSQFVIMRRKQCLGTEQLGITDMLDDCPGNR